MSTFIPSKAYDFASGAAPLKQSCSRKATEPYLGTSRVAKQDGARDEHGCSDGSSPVTGTRGVEELGTVRYEEEDDVHAPSTGKAV
ncbi:uncharacterized protein UV8b_07006 [Ustilaginoidea virens]|uniref:Uncharacterized protein n=1 Tax=Ustilaginoidea virens TaxID=1159556 RepID=A0A8E5HW77_USTVR|nr:uncharacterized protein UV8b_07006 [Ustilaginoidea virens]QUC22765.1 hypothetical protein UV8b_07006 [Ustilaginoidea virens]